MVDNDWLAQRFESDRAQLRAVASRMLGPGRKPTTWSRRRGCG